MNKIQEQNKTFDADEKIAIENMPFFLESLAQRFKDEECPILPKLCRAVGNEIESMQARIELLEEVVGAADGCIADWDNGKWPPSIPLRKALAALKEQT